MTIRLPFSITVRRMERTYNFIAGDVVNLSRWPEIEKRYKEWEKRSTRSAAIGSPETKEERGYETK